MSTDSYLTQGGILVHRTVEEIPVADAIEPVDRRARQPPRRAARLELRVPRPLHALGHGLRRPAAGARLARAARFAVEALNERGRGAARRRSRDARGLPTRSSAPSAGATGLAGSGRARRPAASPRRSAAASRRCSRCCARSSTCSARPTTPHLGLYGAFGYDLAFQFEPMRLRLDAAGRPARPRALPARRARDRRPPPRAARCAAATTSRPAAGTTRGPAARRAARAATRPRPRCPRACDHAPGEYADDRAHGAASRSSAATCSRSCPARRSSSRARRRPPSCSAGCASATRRPTAS